jgi:dihydrodipicolinate synthase/N-acetylneuraminate lyase
MDELISKIASNVVYPIPPAFKNEAFHTEEVEKYLQKLYDRGARTVLTTIGTSRYNLLNDMEIFEFHHAMSTFKGTRILGVPATAEHHLKHHLITIDALDLADAIMIVYPDRYYNDQTIIDFMHSVASISQLPILFHGMFMRNAIGGGTWEFTPKVVEAIKQHGNIIGMKEESINHNTAYKISLLADDNFIVIPAGGSCRRYLMCGPAGAQTFLGGIGNIFPEIENTFYTEYKSGNHKIANEIINDFETPLFNVFEKIGWHKALQIALNLEGLLTTDNREPFSRPSDDEINAVQEILNDIKQRWKR